MTPDKIFALVTLIGLVGMVLGFLYLGYLHRPSFKEVKSDE